MLLNMKTEVNGSTAYYATLMCTLEYVNTALLKRPDAVLGKQNIIDISRSLPVTY